MAEAPPPVTANPYDPRLLQLDLASQIIRPNDVNNAAFEAALAPIVPSDSPPEDFDTLEGLLQLNDPLLNSFGVLPEDAAADADVNADLNAALALSTLQEDVQQLEDAQNLTPNAPLETDAATTVDLSVEAQAIIDNPLAVNVNANGDLELSADALDRVGTALRPLVQQPLTAEVFTQIQAQVQAAGISPLQFSLQTLFSAMQYVSGMMPAAQARAQAAFTPANDMMVAAVKPVARVSAVAENPKR